MSQQLVQYILDDLEDDIVGLWYVVGWAKDLYHGAEVVKIQEVVLDVIFKLLQEERIIAGWPSKDGNQFFRWSGTPEQVVEQIRSEWAKLGRLPGVAEVVWLARPELSGSA